MQIGSQCVGRAPFYRGLALEIAEKAARAGEIAAGQLSTQVKTMSALDTQQASNVQGMSNAPPRGSVQILNLTRDESADLHFIACHSVMHGKAKNAVEQVLEAQKFAEHIKRQIPRLFGALERLSQEDIDALFVTGLPHEVETARLTILAMTTVLGQPFNYKSQNGGELVMSLKPEDGSANNTNATRDEFEAHTDDAYIPRDARVNFIALSGILNPPNTLTGYAPLRDAAADLSHLMLARAQEDAFQVRAPSSFGLEAEVWSAPCPLIKFGPDGEIELRFPSYATRPVDRNSKEDWDVIRSLKAALDAHMVQFALNPGTFLSFNNFRGAHKRGAIGKGDRLILRTYAASSLATLRLVTGEAGPIFSVRPFIFQAN